MNEYSNEVWKSANAILQRFEAMAGAKADSTAEREAVKAQLLTLLDTEDSAGSKPGVEDFEYALQTALMNRLENAPNEKQTTEIISMLEVAASVVVEIFERAARQGAPATETDRCKSWWSMFFPIAEDVSRLIPVSAIETLMGHWEKSLVALQSAYLQLASVRLAEVDAKQVEQEPKKEDEDAEGKDAVKEEKADNKEKDSAKEAAAKELKRIEERKKLINQLSVSPNGQLYLTLTSLLKQLASRLIGSTQAALRARIVLLLERVLAMDHKAIANNQKTRTQDFVVMEDLDTVEEAAKILTQAAEDSTEDASKEKDKSEGKESGKPDFDSALYHSFWSLQEYLHYPERVVPDDSGRRSEIWKKFHESMTNILKFFKQHPVKDARRQPWVEPELMPLRHAPRADSFKVQLHDPGFRQHFLTQALIAFSALEQDASNKLGLHTGAVSRMSDLAKKEYRLLKKSCEEALEHVRPGFLQLLNRALEREAHWLQWKGYGCREFERESQEMLSAKTMPADELLQNPTRDEKGRPKMAKAITDMLKTLKDPQWRVSSIATDSSPEDVASQMQIIKASKMCEANLDRLTEDDKPENGIEEEYKAKKNKVFMWQSRRLFCQQYLQIFAAKEHHNKSDFMDFVKVVRGVPQAPAEIAAAATADANNATNEKSPLPEAEEGEKVGESPVEEADEPVPAESSPADKEVAQEAEAESGPAVTEKVEQESVDAPVPERSGDDVAPAETPTPTDTTKRDAPSEPVEDSSPSAKKARHD